MESPCNVFINEALPDEEDAKICFVCGDNLSENERIIAETETSYLHVPLANKLGQLIGGNFCIVITKHDEICGDCLLIINQVDEMEFNIKISKDKLIGLLQNKYKFNLVEETVEEEEGEIVYEEEDVKPLNFNDDENSLQTPVEQLEEEPFSPPSELLLDFVKEETLKSAAEPLNSTVESIEESTVLSTNDQMENDKFYYLNESASKDILCEYCCTPFYSVEELDEHVKQTHDTESINVVFDSDKKEVSNVIYKCGVCDFSHPDRQDVLKHVHNIHKVVCELCGLFFDNISSLLFHYSSHDKSGGLDVCNICEMPFPSKAVLARHMDVHKRSGGPVVCNICNIVCTDNLQAMYHRRNQHSIIKNLTCGLCDIPVSSNLELKHHILTVHRGKKEFKCTKCDMTFNRLLQFENHQMYAHGDSQCRFCRKLIEDEVKLRKHELRHARSEANKYKCDVCDKTFKTSGGLKVHAVSHTGKYKFFCEFCGRGFMSKVILEEHKGVHTKEERYVCDICGRKFVLNSTFHLHKQWHKNPFPFPCKMCDRKFRYRSERSNHVRRIHTGETPYKCQHCDAAFIKLGYLKKHLVVHTKIHPNTCHICSKGYDQKKALAFHLAKVHNDTSMLQQFPKVCEYKVALRPEEYPDVD